MFGGPFRWLLADEVWHFAGLPPGRRPAEAAVSPIQCVVDGRGFLLRHRASFLGWHLIHRHFCYEGRLEGPPSACHISGVFRFHGFIRGLQLGLLALTLGGAGLAMVPVGMRLYSYSQSGDSDKLVMALAYLGATVAALGAFCFLSRLLKLAGNGTRRALFRFLADLEHS